MFFSTNRKESSFLSQFLFHLHYFFNPTLFFLAWFVLHLRQRVSSKGQDALNRQLALNVGITKIYSTKS
jgi:hypothetical protein